MCTSVAAPSLLLPVSPRPLVQLFSSAEPILHEPSGKPVFESPADEIEMDTEYSWVSLSATTTLPVPVGHVMNKVSQLQNDCHVRCGNRVFISWSC